jgi:hypothetical protein
MYQVYYGGQPVVSLEAQDTVEKAQKQLEARAKALGYPVECYGIGKHTVVMLKRVTKTITTYEENAQ